MASEIIKLLEIILSIVITFFFAYLSHYRYEENKKYAEKYANNTVMLLLGLVVDNILKWGSYLIVFALALQKLSVFIGFYIFVPTLIGLHIIFYNDEYIKGLMTMIKGLYYIGVIIVSIIQVFFVAEKISELAIGFTVSLAIFESLTALSEGYKNVCKSKRK